MSTTSPGQAPPERRGTWLWRREARQGEGEERRKEERRGRGVGFRQALQNECQKALRQKGGDGKEVMELLHPGTFYGYAPGPEHRFTL